MPAKVPIMDNLFHETGENELTFLTLGQIACLFVTFIFHFPPPKAVGAFDSGQRLNGMIVALRTKMARQSVSDP